MGVTTSSPVLGSVVLDGDLTWAAAPGVRLALLAAVAAPRVWHVVVDLSGVTFLDCAGVGVLIFGRNAATALDLPFSVVNVSEPARHLLALLGVLDLLERPSRRVAQRAARTARSWSPGEPGGRPAAAATVPAPRSAGPPRRVAPPGGYRSGDPGEPG